MINLQKLDEQKIFTEAIEKRMSNALGEAKRRSG